MFQEIFFCVVAPRLPIEADLDSAARSVLESSLVNSGERKTHRRNAEGPKETDRILLSRGIVESGGHFFSFALWIYQILPYYLHHFY